MKHIMYKIVYKIYKGIIILPQSKKMTPFLKLGHFIFLSYFVVFS